jgi:hypothetical protein
MWGPLASKVCFDKEVNVKRKAISIVLAAALLLTMGLATTLPVGAATEDEIEASIAAGIDWLVLQQQPDGSWSPGSAPVAHTGLALVKLCDRAYETGYSPFDPGYEYAANVEIGFDYLFDQASPAGMGILFLDPADPWYENYCTGIAAMAIAASRTPDRPVPTGLYAGQTYKEVLQAVVDYFAWAQTDAPAAQRGGWGYAANSGWADQSNTGYSVMGLRYAEAGLYGFQCDIPQLVKDEHMFWVNYIQRPDGGSDYDGTWGWSNLLRTGNLLLEQSFLGIDIGDPRVQAAIGYIESNWNPTADSQTMYCLMKGFESYGIETITVGGNPVDWFDVFADHIIATQHADGYWDTLSWGVMLDTLFALLTLEKFAPPPPVIEVPVDIHPMSWPNPLNVNKKGVLPVAILGTEDFDVTQIDPATILLEGVAPLRWALEDVGTPGDPLAGPDGILDLSLKFEAQEIVAALGPVNDCDVLTLQLTGNLKEEFSGTAIVGEDVVWIIKKK